MIDIVDVKEAVKKGEVKVYVKNNIIYLTYCNTEETVMIGEFVDNSILNKIRSEIEQKIIKKPFMNFERSEREHNDTILDCLDVIDKYIK